MPRARLLAILLLCLAPLAPGAPKWVVRYYFDEDQSSLHFSDIHFTTPRRGIAVGHFEEKHRPRPAALVTNDGGATWNQVAVKDTGISLFFLDESQGWMVAQRGIWKTEEGGLSWKKISGLSGVFQVYFRDAQRGWAVATNKRLLETANGGRDWQRVKIVDEPKSNPDLTSFTAIGFAGNDGLVTGFYRRPRRNEDRVPDWIDPERAGERREWPGLTISAETQDGGRTWKASTVSMFGRIARLRLSSRGFGLALIEFVDAFEYPSEVFYFTLRKGGNTRVFREKNVTVTDIVIPPAGPAYMAAVERPGSFTQSPLPGKVRIFRSHDLKKWETMAVDYRAVARRVVLTALDETRIWAATDEGMILELAGQ